MRKSWTQKANGRPAESEEETLLGFFIKTAQDRAKAPKKNWDAILTLYDKHKELSYSWVPSHYAKHFKVGGKSGTMANWRG